MLLTVMLSAGGLTTSINITTPMLLADVVTTPPYRGDNVC